MKISEIIDSGKEKVLQLKEKQSKTKNIKIIEKTTLANGTPVHTVKNIPNDKNTQELLKAYPIDAPTVAASIQTEMENGTLKGPNGETNINDCDSNWISIETIKRVDENIKRVSGEITSNKIDNISSETETTQSNTKATEVPIKEEKFPLTQNKLTTKLNKVGYRNIGSILNSSMHSIKIIDSTTGKEIPIRTIMDSARVSRNGYYNSVWGSHTIPNNLLAEFVTNPKESYSPHDCVEALGLYNTEYVRDRAMKFTNANMDLHEPENDMIKDKLVFRNYVQYGGYSTTNGKTGKPDGTTNITDEQGRNAQFLGTGLGECLVMNPAFQFNKRDDPRTNPVWPRVGRVYSTQFMNNWPIVFFQPGRLKYHTGFMDMLGLGAGAGAVESLIRTGGDGISGLWAKFKCVTTDIISVVGAVGSAVLGGSRMMEFKQSINLYKQYLWFLMQSLAGIMGLTDDKGKYIGSIEKLAWEFIHPSRVLSGGMERFHNAQFIPFRCSKDINASESFSNSTTSNPIMEKMNAQAEEAESGVDTNDPSKGIADKAAAFLKKTGMKIAGSFSEQALVLSGRGRITLPDIFESSSFSRSLSLEFKFHSPYGDIISIFENEFIPFLILLAMSAPRQTGKLTYASPFAIRVFVKNHININFGMVESLSVTRGGDNNDWCPNGFPKTLTCTMQIKDMEPNISLPLASRGPVKAALESMFPSSGISEYLGSIGGLPMDEIYHDWRKSKLTRSINMVKTSWSNWWDRDITFSGWANTTLGSKLIGLFSGSDIDLLNVTGGNMALAKENLVSSMVSANVAPGSMQLMVDWNGLKDYYGAVTKVDGEDADNSNNLSKAISGDNLAR